MVTGRNSLLMILIQKYSALRSIRESLILIFRLICHVLKMKLVTQEDSLRDCKVWTQLYTGSQLHSPAGLMTSASLKQNDSGTSTKELYIFVVDSLKLPLDFDLAVSGTYDVTRLW